MVVVLASLWCSRNIVLWLLPYDPESIEHTADEDSNLYCQNIIFDPQFLTGAFAWHDDH